MKMVNIEGTTTGELDDQFKYMKRTQIGVLDLLHRPVNATDHAYFAGAIYAAEALGYFVKVEVVRDSRIGVIDRMVAFAIPTEPSK